MNHSTCSNRLTQCKAFRTLQCYCKFAGTITRWLTIAASETPSLPERMPDVSDLRMPAGMRQTSAAVPAGASNAAPAAVNNLPTLAPAEAAAIARLQQLGPNAEVICIVKSRITDRDKV